MPQLRARPDVDDPERDRRSLLRRRALALWPRLDPAALRRCGDDPGRIAALIARRTTLSPDTIRQMLERADPIVSDDERETWFG
jgi:hypothetical protein